MNHDNEYLHYQDDWYIVDFEGDNNPENIPPYLSSLFDTKKFWYRFKLRYQFLTRAVLSTLAIASVITQKGSWGSSSARFWVVPPRNYAGETCNGFPKTQIRLQAIVVS